MSGWQPERPQLLESARAFADRWTDAGAATGGSDPSLRRAGPSRSRGAASPASASPASHGRRITRHTRSIMRRAPGDHVPPEGGHVLLLPGERVVVRDESRGRAGLLLDPGGLAAAGADDPLDGLDEAADIPIRHRIGELRPQVLPASPPVVTGDDAAAG